MCVSIMITRKGKRQRIKCDSLLKIGTLILVSYLTISIILKLSFC